MTIGSKLLLRNIYVLKVEGDILVDQTVEVPVESLDDGQMAFYEYAVIPIDVTIMDVYQGVGVINPGTGLTIAAGVHSVINYRRQIGGATHKIDVILQLSSDAPRNVHYKVYRKAGLD